VIKPKSVMAAVVSKVPKDFVELNTRAFELGLELGSDYSW
ncbi:MAG: 2-oxoacid:ferredoxin oxidoreductase subunit gamma, partial [Desulfobulbaceae bacterium]|nr:2-oxoacid:ferredoxin oxidoreductase subunit gamma [Desulfobulbaceae bacterium]